MRVKRMPRPAPPPTPGEVLRDRILSVGGITQERLAKAMRVSRLSVSQIVNGHRAVTAEMALRLAKATSTTPMFWLDLQRGVDLHDARRRLQRDLRAIRVVRRPVPRRQLFYKVRA